MLTKLNARTWGLWTLLLTLGGASPLHGVHAQGPATPPAAAHGSGTVTISATRSNVEIAERFSKVFHFPAQVKRVDGFDPSVISATPLSPTEIRVQAVEQGVTTIVFTDETGQTYQVEVFVTGDARLLQAVLRRHFPNTAVDVIKVRDSVVLRGWVSEPQQITEIVEFARVYHPEVINQMKVGGPQEVQLRVKVMEVQRSLIRRFGINFAAIGRNAALVSTPGPVTGLEAFTVPFGGPPAATFAANQLSNTSLALGIATDDFVFQGLIQALKEEGLLKIQAEPVLVTRSGEAARLVNGGEFPIPVPQGLGQVTIEWREFGVILESLPMVLGPTTLKQTIRAEVSERDFSTAVTLNGTTVPGLTTRTVQTQAVMEFGQTLVIGGLIATRYTAETDKIPFLGELPGVGAAFRRTRYDTAETELLVLITPEYVSSLAPDQVPPGGPGRSSTIPTDRELYWDGVVEVPNYGDRCETCGPNGGPMGMGSAGPTPLPGGYSAPELAPMPIDGGDPNLITPPGMLRTTPPTSAPTSPPPPPAPATSAKRSSPPTIIKASSPVTTEAAKTMKQTSDAAAPEFDGLFEPTTKQP
ncbi:MAG: pilus assembly protein N-terminal domain-containing protein [Planctomycetaceae bacterium]|nr:pilus assembly protein N-terminal domain-containing protein [Planctomycetaceae bacterium]